MNRPPADLQAGALETTWGAISIAATGRGVAACRLPMATDPSVPLRVLRLHLPRGASPVLRHAAGYVRAVLEGRIPGKIPPLDPAAFQQASAFRGAVWRTLGKIERGRTATYAQLARRAGHPRAARAAGSACGANPLPLFIPCHRVLAAGGRLGGFSAGLAWKRHLLAVERAQP